MKTILLLSDRKSKTWQSCEPTALSQKRQKTDAGAPSTVCISEMLLFKGWDPQILLRKWKVFVSMQASWFLITCKLNQPDRGFCRVRCNPKGSRVTSDHMVHQAQPRSHKAHPYTSYSRWKLNINPILKLKEAHLSDLPGNWSGWQYYRWKTAGNKGQLYRT